MTASDMPKTEANTCRNQDAEHVDYVPLRVQVQERGGAGGERASVATAPAAVAPNTRRLNVPKM